MALTMDTLVEELETTVNAYINISRMRISKNEDGTASISGVLHFYSSELARLENKRPFESMKFTTDFTIGGDCPYVQIYTYLKTLDKFSAAVDA